MGIFDKLKDQFNKYAEKQERRKTLEIHDISISQGVDYFTAQRSLEMSEAMKKYNEETDPERKRKMKALLVGGIYNFDHIDDR